MSEIRYNPWPLPKDESLQRIELQQLKEAGYWYDDPREINTLFEQKLCEFTGAKYAVLTDCCTHSLELALRYKHFKERPEHMKFVYFCDPIQIPLHTYISVYEMIGKIGDLPLPEYKEWSGLYFLGNTNIVDSAVRWEEKMYIPGTLQCLSFQIKKPICIGRGGCVLTDDKEASDWIRLASYDGRDLNTPYDQPGHVKMQGYHYYMTPEDAARGILLMDKVKFRGDSANWTNYPDISKMI